MSINFRRPNGYFITRPARDLLDKYKPKQKPGRWRRQDTVKEQEAKDESVLFVFNGELEVEVNRYKVAHSTCFFLNKILTGPFRESRQSTIDIYLQDDFTFEVFKGLVEFAERRELKRNSEDVDYYLKMLQLAYIWIYDEFVRYLELHLLNFVKLDYVAVLHTLANYIELPLLKGKCLELEKRCDRGMGTMVRRWGRCPLDGHYNHRYGRCPEEDIDEEDWGGDCGEELDEQPSDTIYSDWF